MVGERYVYNEDTALCQKNRQARPLDRTYHLTIMSSAASDIHKDEFRARKEVYRHRIWSSWHGRSVWGHNWRPPIFLMLQIHCHSRTFGTSPKANSCPTDVGGLGVVIVTQAGSSFFDHTFCTSSSLNGHCGLSRPAYLLHQNKGECTSYRSTR